MKNFLSRGDTVLATAPADLASGDPVLIGALFGIAEVAVANGKKVPLVRRGAFTLPKATGAAWTQGDALYWDNTAKNVTKVTTNNTRIGIAFADALSGDTTGGVLLGIETV